MIIFDLDGTLANCEHRRHLIKPDQYKHLCEYSNYYIDKVSGKPIVEEKASWRYKDTGKAFQHGWKAFYEACDKDEPIYPTLNLLETLITHDEYEQLPLEECEIWSGRCESVRKKTLDWLDRNLKNSHRIKLKMRPIGDSTPDDELKERWLDEAIREGKTIDFVFDDRPKVIRAWRRRGIFVFNCCQHDEEF